MAMTRTSELVPAFQFNALIQLFLACASDIGAWY
jgi:hypothetical protein